MFKTIVIGIDGSKASFHAAVEAANLGLMKDAEVELVGLDADHFALMSHREEIVRALVKWLRAEASRSEAELSAPR